MNAPRALHAVPGEGHGQGKEPGHALAQAGYPTWDVCADGRRGGYCGSCGLFAWVGYVALGPCGDLYICDDCACDLVLAYTALYHLALVDLPQGDAAAPGKRGKETGFPGQENAP